MTSIVRILWPWIGLLITLFASNLSTCEAGSAPAKRNFVFDRLDQTRSYGQTFVLERGELAAIRVLLFAPRESLDDLVTLRLHYPDENLPDLARTSMPLHRFSSNGMTTFAFDTVPLPASADASNLTLQFTIEARTLHVGNGISVIGGPDTYAAGRLYVNGNAVDAADLAFQPVYRVRWIDRILPITNMADGKPGILGWPPFYALIAYAYVYLLLRGLMRLRR